MPTRATVDATLQGKETASVQRDAQQPVHRSRESSAALAVCAPDMCIPLTLWKKSEVDRHKNWTRFEPRFDKIGHQPIDCTAISSQNASSSVAAATLSGTNKIEVVSLDHQSWLY
jgi:hypothetical protein